MKKANGVVKELSKEDRSYYTAADVMLMLGVGKTKAYNMITALRKELFDSGTLTPVYPPGRIPKRYFNDRCMIV